MAKKELTEALFQARRCGSIWHLLQLIVNKIESLANKVSGFGIVVGSTETVSPGEGASVTATGTKEQPILHFKIPKGDKGEPGPQGEPGNDAQAIDVRIAGNSITDNGVANIPIATNGGSPGLIKFGAESFGLGIGGAGQAFVRSADSNGIQGRVTFEVISPRNIDYAVKRAMCDGVGAAYTVSEQDSARKRIGASPYLNLLSTTFSTPGTFGASGEEVTNDGYAIGSKRTDYYIPVTAGSWYTCGRKAGQGDYFRINIYDKYKNYIRGIALTNIGSGAAGTQSWQAPSNAAYVRVGFPDSYAYMVAEDAHDYTPNPFDIGIQLGASSAADYDAAIYETTMAQSDTIAEQDEAICELYEMIMEE